MKRSIPSLLVIGLMAALLASCGQSATGQQTGVTPTASSHAHLSRIAWQGFLDPDQSTSAIFSANADGSDARQLTHPSHGEQDGFPDWSPDDSQILFAHVAANGTSDVWVMNADGTGLKQLTSCTGVCNGAQWGRWSPDGSKIVYSVADNPIRPDGNASLEALWIMNADGSHPVQFTHPRCRPVLLITRPPGRPMASRSSLRATTWWGSRMRIRRCSSSIGMAPV